MMKPLFGYLLRTQTESETLHKAPGGILVTEGLEEAKARCKSKVDRLEKDCLQSKRKFRDPEFDILEDRSRCLHRLHYDRTKPRYNPEDIRRISDIVDDPQFTVEGATANDISQGAIGDCWFLSALAVIAAANIIEDICVEKRPKVGIYGFIFWCDSGWTEVIVDDLVFTKVPPWEALKPAERGLYNDDRTIYEKTRRRGLFQNLYFAKSTTDNETWVPLIEKAYAKLHGDYESLEGGFTSEGVEDLTGGVSTLIYRGDILDDDDFWKEELKEVCKTRLFACFTPGSTPGGADRKRRPLGNTEIDGLITDHAYSITKAVEFKDNKGQMRRFVKIRNPWGKREWVGPWSDGSKEWNEDWTKGLREKLGDYKFGNDGEFVQEFKDFLASWGIIERSRLFTDEWRMSSQWLQMPPDAHQRPWTHGEVSFTIDIVNTEEESSEEESEVIIVLAQRDTRYFKELSGQYLWNLDFLLYRHDEEDPTARSVHSTMWSRSVKVEVQLPPGKYVVHARLDCKLKEPESSIDLPDGTAQESAPSFAHPDWRKHRRKQMALTASAMIAANCKHDLLPFKHLSIPARELGGRDLSEIEFHLSHTSIQSRNYSGSLGSHSRAGSMDTLIPGSAVQEHQPVEDNASTYSSTDDRWKDTAQSKRAPARNLALPQEQDPRYTHKGFKCYGCQVKINGMMARCLEPACHSHHLCVHCVDKHAEDHKLIICACPADEDVIPSDIKLDEQCVSCGQINAGFPNDEQRPSDLILGLRVYTRKPVTTTIQGQLRTGNALRTHIFTEKAANSGRGRI